MGENIMMCDIITDIKLLAEDLDYLYYFSDLMTKSEILKEIEDTEKRISSILEDIQKYKEKKEHGI